jgi:hypothetical protein
MSALFISWLLTHNMIMQYFSSIFLLILYSCSQVSPRKVDPVDYVTLRAAMNQARSSYLKGCVDTYHSLKIPKVFTHCVDRAKAHEDELMEIMKQNP